MDTAISPDIFGFKFKHFVNDCLASTSVALQKEWEPHITKFTQLYNAFYNIKNTIDIGANFGYHTLFFSRECSENVYAFEPQSQNYKLLEDNVAINGVKNVCLYNYACGDEDCEIQMPIFNSTSQINMGDITPNMGHNCASFSTERSIALDQIEFPSKIDLIKLDVQGWEKKVLAGATRLLETHKPTLIVEFEYFQLSKTGTTCTELFGFIRNQNYYIFYLESPYPCDHVCVHNDNLTHFRQVFEKFILPHTENNNLNNNVINGVCEKILIF
jgi:FkbM family methyltransferase